MEEDTEHQAYTCAHMRTILSTSIYLHHTNKQKARMCTYILTCCTFVYHSKVGILASISQATKLRHWVAEGLLPGSVSVDSDRV